MFLNQPKTSIISLKYIKKITKIKDYGIYFLLKYEYINVYDINIQLMLMNKV